MCPLSEETQPVRPVPVSLAGIGHVPSSPAGSTPVEGEPAHPRTSGSALGDTQPVKTQPVKTQPVRTAAAVSGPPERDLGRLIFAYRPRPVSPAFQWAWGLGGAVFSLGPLAYGGYLAFVTYQKFGPVPAFSRSGAWIISGGLLLLAWLSISLYRRATALPGVRLHANGLYIEGRPERSLTWDQINGIALGVTALEGFAQGGFAHGAIAAEEGQKAQPRDKRYHASLYPNQGRPIHLHGSGDGKSGLPELPELVRRVKASLYPVLQPELARMFRSGVPLHFGPVRIDREGLRLRRRRPVPGTLSVPWGHVKRITVQSGYFLVELGDRRDPYRLPVVQIPNLEILLKIIDQGVQQ